MKLNEVTSKRDIGVNYDEGKAIAEIRETFENVDFETLDRLFRNSIQQGKEVESMVRVLRSTYSLRSITNQTAVNQLLQLMLNIRKSDVDTLGNLWRKKKREV